MVFTSMGLTKTYWTVFGHWIGYWRLVLSMNLRHKTMARAYSRQEQYCSILGLQDLPPYSYVYEKDHR